jgi:ABC-2 type transport system permease protein
MTATTSPPATSAPAPEHRPTTELTGTVRLLRLAIRRDRVVLPVWLLLLVGLLIASVASVAGIYGSEEDRVAYATVAASNPVPRAFDGPMAGTELGAIVMTESFGILALLAGIMSVQALTRHTRQEEETGRAELVSSTIVGRDARLVAALLLTLGANLVLAVGTTAALLAYGLAAPGSVLAGLALGGVGLTFAAVGAVGAQLAQTARGANGLGVAVVGVAFLLRAVGDAFGTVAESGVEVISAWPSWLSPIGWGQQVKPYGGDHAGVLLLFLAATAVLVAVAFVLTRHRDVGAGMLPVRPGPATASRWLSSPAGLVVRLGRGGALGWAVGLALVAAAIGSIVDEVEALLETSDELIALITAAGAGG